MGTGPGTGLNFGNSFGARREQQNDASQESNHLTESQLIAELEEKGIKFTKKDVLFITKDKTGQTVWLEKGNSGAGLEHILNGNGHTSGYANDFEKAFGIKRDDIPQYLKKVIECGDIIGEKLKNTGKRVGFERIYYYEGKYCVVTGIGTNGFIVSAYPTAKEAIK